MVTGGELVSAHMPKKSQLKNWLHECQLLASVTLPLDSTVGTILLNRRRGLVVCWIKPKYVQVHTCIRRKHKGIEV